MVARRLVACAVISILVAAVMVAVVTDAIPRGKQPPKKVEHNPGPLNEDDDFFMGEEEDEPVHAPPPGGGASSSGGGGTSGSGDGGAKGGRAPGQDGDLPILGVRAPPHTCLFGANALRFLPNLINVTLERQSTGMFGVLLVDEGPWIVVGRLTGVRSELLTLGTAIMAIDGEWMWGKGAEYCINKLRQAGHSVKFTVLKNFGLIGHDVNDLVLVTLTKAEDGFGFAVALAEKATRIMDLVARGPGFLSGCIRAGDSVLSVDGGPWQPAPQVAIQRLKAERVGGTLSILLHTTLPGPVQQLDDGSFIIPATVTRELSMDPFGIKFSVSDGEIVISDLSVGDAAYKGNLLREGDELRAFGPARTHMIDLEQEEMSFDEIMQHIGAMKTHNLVLYVRRIPRKKVGSGGVSTSGPVSSMPQGSYQVVLARDSEGIGIHLVPSKHQDLGRLQVSRVQEGSSAQRSGAIHIGDVLLAVNDVNVRNLELEQLAILIRQTPMGMTMIFTFARPAPSMAAEPPERKLIEMALKTLQCNVHSPPEAVSALTCAAATFGRLVPTTTPFIGTVLLSPSPNACGKPTPAMIASVPANLTDGVMVVTRGGCFFHEKALFAQQLGMKAIIVVNERPDMPTRLDAPLQREEELAAENVNIITVMITEDSGRYLTKVAKAYSPLRVSLYAPFRGQQVDNNVLFENHFDTGMFSMQRGVVGAPSQPYKPTAQIADLQLTLVDLLRGKHIDYAFQRHTMCPVCGGIGAPQHHLRACPMCGGPNVTMAAGSNHRSSGLATWKSRLGRNVTQTRTQTCPLCKGEGVVFNRHLRCDHCHGAGTIAKPASIHFTTQPGVPYGYQYIFSGAGSSQLHISPPDIGFRVTEVPMTRFKRDGANIIHDLVVPVALAVSGTVMKMENFDGEQIEVKVPRLAYEGQKITVPKKGLPIFKPATAAEELIKTVKVMNATEELPKLSEEQIVMLPRGDLICSVHILLPDSLPQAQGTLLREMVEDDGQTQQQNEARQEQQRQQQQP